MTVSNCDLVYALKMVARASHADVAIGPDVTGYPSLRGKFSSGSAVEALLEGTNAEWAVDDGVLVVAPAGHLKERLDIAHANAAQLSSVAPDSKKVTLDFVNADLGYVCEVCSKEMSANNRAPLPEGGVTVTLHNRPISKVFGLALGLQESPVTVSVSAPNISYAQAPLKKKH